MEHIGKFTGQMIFKRPTAHLLILLICRKKHTILWSKEWRNLELCLSMVWMRGPLTLNPWQRKLRPLPRMKVCHTSSLKNYLCIWLVSYVSILLDKLNNLKFYNIDNIKYMMHCCPHWNLNVSNTCMTLNDYFFFFGQMVNCYRHPSCSH